MLLRAAVNHQLPDVAEAVNGAVASWHGGKRSEFYARATLSGARLPKAGLSPGFVITILQQWLIMGRLLPAVNGIMKLARKQGGEVSGR